MSTEALGGETNGEGCLACPARWPALFVERGTQEMLDYKLLLSTVVLSSLRGPRQKLEQKELFQNPGPRLLAPPSHLQAAQQLCVCVWGGLIHSSARTCPIAHIHAWSRLTLFAGTKAFPHIEPREGRQRKEVTVTQHLLGTCEERGRGFQEVCVLPSAGNRRGQKYFVFILGFFK